MTTRRDDVPTIGYQRTANTPGQVLASANTSSTTVSCHWA